MVVTDICKRSYLFWKVRLLLSLNCENKYFPLIVKLIKMKMEFKINSDMV